MSLISKGEHWEVALTDKGISSGVAELKIWCIEPRGLWDYNSWAEDVLKYANKIKNKYKVKNGKNKKEN